MALTKFDIDLEPGTGSKIVIDGVDVAHQVTRVTVDVGVGDRVPKVFLEMRGEGRLQGEGIVHEVRDLDHRQVIKEFLGALDPQVVDEMVLKESEGFGDTRSTGRMFLDVLVKMVNGVDNHGS